MQHRRFGRTGLQVPAVTFGGGWVGGVLIHGSEAVANEALDTAWAASIDWVDTAADYGKGVSETVIGRWLAGRAADQRPGISTKFRIDPAAGDFRGQMQRSVEASLGRLGLDRVNVVILHNQIDVQGNRGARSMDADAALAMADAMESLREQGLCDWLGMTALGEPEALAKVVDAGRFDIAQAYYNMLNPTAWEGRRPWNSTNFEGLLKRCEAQDMGVMGIRIFAGGHLATTERHGREIPVTANAEDAAEEWRARLVWKILGETDGHPAQAALRFGLGCPGLSTVVVGLGEIEHLRLALAAEEMGPLPEAVIDALEGVWQDPAFTG